MSFISEIYNNAVAAYGLNKLFSTYTGPLVRVVRESDFVEVDVLPDDNFEVSHDSLVIGSADTGAVTLGQFMNIPTYDNPDSLPDVYESRIVTLYDQSAGRRNAVYSGFFTSLLYVKHSSEILFGVGYEILSVNNTPAFYVLSSSKLVSIPNVLDRELSFHMLAASTQTSFNTGLELQEAFATNVIGSIALNPISQSVGILPTTETDRFDVSGIYINSFNCPETSTNVYTKSESDNEPYQILTAELKAQDSTYNQNAISNSTNYPSFFFLNNNYYSSVVVYDGYNNTRRLDIESYLGAYSTNTILTKNLSSIAFSVETPQGTDNSFIAQFETPAAAYSVRDLRGGVDAEGDRVTKIMRVRREYDNAEVDVYADSSGFVSLDSPVVAADGITGGIEGGTGLEFATQAETLGEFVNDAEYDDADTIGNPTSAKVSIWYDQSSADYTIISEEIDSRGAPIRIRVEGGDYNDFEFDVYFDDNDTISLDSYIADTYEITDTNSQVTSTLTSGTMQDLVDAGMTDAFVTVWYDQSGNGNDATQSVLGSQPQIYDGGFVIEGGEPAIEFDGINDVLYKSTALTTPNSVSLFFVSDLPVANARRLYHIKSENDNISMAVGTGTQVAFRTLTNDVSYDGPAIDGEQQSLVSLFDSDVIYKNGVEILTKDDTGLSFQGASGIYLGSRADLGNTAPVTFQEFIYYPDNQYAADNRTNIESNINDYYDIYGTGNTGDNEYLLDTYTGAAAAYSLRKLRTDYTGPVNTNKRKDAIQQTATAQPKIYDSSTGIVIENGKPAVQFDGTNDHLLKPITLTDTGDSFVATFIAVAQANNPTSDNDSAYPIALYPNASAVDRRFYELSLENTQTAVRNQGGNTIFNAGDGQAQCVFMAAHINTNSPSVGRLNGSDLTVSSSANVALNMQSDSAIVLGVAGFPTSYTSITQGMDGKLQEALYYNSDQYTANRIDIENNINSAFQIYAANFSSVLDTVPLAKAAYSIRRLTKNYIDPIITVTNGSTTKDFYADFWGNLDVDALTSFANGGTLSVTKWWDQSGEGVHLLTTADKPTLAIASNEVSVNTTNKFYEPLLDRYEGAAAAYSLRILKGDYTGPLVRIRRDITNTEVDVYPDENLTISLNSPVLDVAEATTDVTASPQNTLATTLGEFVADAGSDPDGLGATVSAFVVVWYDQANSNNASQDISTSQPKIYDSVDGVVTENGKPAVQFDDTDDRFVLSTIQATVSNYEIFAVSNSTSTNTSWFFDARSGRLILDAQSTVFSGSGDAYWDGANNIGNKFTDNIQSVKTWILDSTGNNSAAVYQNGTLWAGSLPYTQRAIDGIIRLGDSSYDNRGWGGRLQELVFYATNPTGNRTGIESNINDHYQIPSFNATASTAQTVAVYNNAINTTVDLNATYTDLKEIIKYE